MSRMDERYDHMQEQPKITLSDYYRLQIMDCDALLVVRMEVHQYEAQFVLLAFLLDTASQHVKQFVSRSRNM
jgi:hypothetical protein